MIQTLESKKRILKNNIYDKKVLSLIRDPIIDYNKIQNKNCASTMNKMKFVLIVELFLLFQS